MKGSVKMAYSYEYPYTDPSRSNSDWLLNNMKSLNEKFIDFIKVNTIKYANPIEWKITTQYEANTVVIDENTGNAYLSVKEVPKGVNILNNDYWLPIFNYEATIDNLREEIAEANEKGSAVATKDRHINDLVWLNNKLVRIIAEMVEGEQYIKDSNYVETTVEKEIIARIEAVKTEIISTVNDIIDPIKEIYVSSFAGDTDAEKLQNAVNYAIDNYYPVIVIDKDYDITGSTIKLNKGLFISNDDFLRYRNKLTFNAVKGARIIKKDAGFFFTADIYSGDFAFNGVAFLGNVVLDNRDDIAHKWAGNSIFDCSKLIRITTVNCSYTLVGVVFDGRLSTGATTDNMQTIRAIGDLCTYSGALMYINRMWDCSLIGCIIENCNYGIKGNKTASQNCIVAGLTIDSCCIEANGEGAIDLSSNASLGDADIQVTNFNCINSYFENNKDVHINLDTTLTCANITGNRFAFTRDGEIAVKIRSDRQGNSLQNNLISGNAPNGYLCYVTKTVSRKYPVFLYDNNQGSSHASNDVTLGTNIVQTIINDYLSGTEAGITNMDNLTGNGIARILTSDNIQGLPDGNTEGMLIWFRGVSLSAPSMQIFIPNVPGSAQLNNMYIRFSLLGNNFYLWKKIALSPV